MKNKRDGFTLVEILAVMVIVAILLVLVVPNALKMGNKTKEKAYETKIGLIEQAAISYGQDNKKYIMKGIKDSDTRNAHVCKEENGKVSLDPNTKVYDPAEKLPDGTYRCAEVTLEELVNAGYLSWDSENQCDNNNCFDKNNNDVSKYFNNTIVNPVDNNIINNCRVYVYYKYTRIYASYNKTLCDMKSADNYLAGKEYNPIAKR